MVQDCWETIHVEVDLYIYCTCLKLLHRLVFKKSWNDFFCSRVFPAGPSLNALWWRSDRSVKCHEAVISWPLAASSQTLLFVTTTTRLLIEYWLFHQGNLAALNWLVIGQSPSPMVWLTSASQRVSGEDVYWPNTHTHSSGTSDHLTSVWTLTPELWPLTPYLWTLTLIVLLHRNI